MITTKPKIRIEKDVQDFLKAFFQINKANFHFRILSLFPNNCCEFTSMLLARFLIEERGYKITDVLMIKGQCRKKSSQLHLWLDVLDIKVDLTSGQFEDAPKIIIAEYHYWHDHFQIVDIYLPEINFDNYLGDYEERALEYDYMQIIKQINGNLIAF